MSPFSLDLRMCIIIRMSRLSIAQAARNFAETVKEAEEDVIEVTRHGEPVIALVPIEEYRRLCHLASPLRDRVKAWAKSQKKLTRVREWE